MANRSLRVDGMTIRGDETYSGATVLRLLEVSFENGKRQGMNGSQENYRKGFEAGFEAGKKSACETLHRLRDTLREIMEQGDGCYRWLKKYVKIANVFLSRKATRE